MDNNNTDGNRLYKDANPGTTTSPNPYLSPTSGTFSNPTPLDTNSWGYALSSTTPGLPAAGSSFDATYNVSVPDQNSKWASVPLVGNEQLIQTITMPDSTNGIDTDVYYGVKANTTLPSGSYKGTVTYTAVARTSSQAGDTISVSPSVTTKLEGGETLTIATMLNVDANDAEDANNPVSVTVGGQACANVSLSNAQDGSLQISCTAPSMATGKYDVGVDVSKYSKFWVIVNGIQYKYSTQELDQVTGGNATAADIMLGKTAYVGGTELTGTMPSYTLQYDTNKTAEENTQDSGLTWSSDGSTLTIAEGYHTQQQVNSQSGGGPPQFNLYGTGTYDSLGNNYRISLSKDKSPYFIISGSAVGGNCYADPASYAEITSATGANYSEISRGSINNEQGTNVCSSIVLYRVEVQSNNAELVFSYPYSIWVIQNVNPSVLYSTGNGSSSSAITISNELSTGRALILTAAKVGGSCSYSPINSMQINSPPSNILYTLMSYNYINHQGGGNTCSGLAIWYLRKIADNASVTWPSLSKLYIISY